MKFEGRETGFRTARRDWFTEERFFLVAVIPLALIIMLLTSAHAWQDGTTHFWTVYHLSNQVLGIDGENEWNARAEDISLFNRVKDDKGIAVTQEMFEDFHIFSRDDSMDTMVKRPMEMTYYSVVSYLPQTMGISLGRLLNFSGIITFLLGRLFMLAVYVLLCYRAIRRTPIGKSVFMVLSLMPFTLLIASSFSYDAMVYVVTINFISCMLALRFQFNRMVLIEAFVFTALLGAVKGGGYLILMPLILLILISDRQVLSLKKQIMIIVGLLLTGLLSVFLFDVIIPAGQELFQFGKEESGSYAANYIWQNPFGYLWLVISTNITDMVNTLLVFGGTPTGFMNILVMIFGPLYACFERKKYLPGRADKVILAVVIALMIIFIPMMLLRVTPEGEYYVSGLRARYYLPMMPLVLILIGHMGFWKKLGKQTGFNPESDGVKLKKACMLICAIINVCGVIRIL